MEGTQRDIVWATPLTPDRDMLPDQETINQLLAHEVSIHDNAAMRALFPPFHDHTETFLPAHPSKNFLLCAHNKCWHYPKKKAIQLSRLLKTSLSPL